jgi:hypothetical protein
VLLYVFVSAYIYFIGRRTVKIWETIREAIVCDRRKEKEASSFCSEMGEISPSSEMGEISPISGCSVFYYIYSSLSHRQVAVCAVY